MTSNPAEEVIIPVYIHTSATDLTHFVAMSTDMQAYGYVLIEKIDLPYKIPSRKVIVEKAVEVLQVKQNELTDEYYSRMSELDDSINKLLCLEYKSDLGSDL